MQIICPMTGVRQLTGIRHSPTSKEITILPVEERLPNVPKLPERELKLPELTEEMKAARESWEKRWEEYSPARQEQFRIKEEKQDVNQS